jgi:tetratricopeptide (TPR) repeat protein
MNALLWAWIEDRSKVVFAACWAVLLMAAVLVYYPGLSGPFLLDDFGSIPPLGDHGGVTDWESFKLFVFGGNAGPTGRPISLLSFLIDANDWPAESWSFKRTNLIIHLINGGVLGILVSLVLKCVAIRGRDNQLIALVSTAIWILHPFLVSTTLYIVQRMAQLSALFMFAGLALYIYGRLQTAVNSTRAYVVMTTAVGVFTLLAMLSKENGILLPVLVGVTELTVVASQRQRLPALNRYWAGIFIVLPAVVIGLYLGERISRGDVFDIVPPRDFSIYERFLTQGRILIDYLQHWYLPKLYTTGVFQDHFIKSTGMLSPVTTGLSYLFHIALIFLALAKRRQFPLFSFCVLFFYASHLLESTVLNLELYFEHRNYIAAAFLFLPIVEFIYRKASFRAFIFTSLAAVFLVGSFTRFSATVWSSLPSMIESSALKAPTSPRAQAQWAKLLYVAGKKDEALAVIGRAIENVPGDRQLLLMSKLFFLCDLNLLSQEEFNRITARLSGLPFDSRSLKAYNVAAQEILTGKCPNIEPEMLEAVFVKMLDVPTNAVPTSLQYSHVNFLIGYARIYAGQPVAALEAFQESLNSRPGPSHAMAMAALLASNNYYREALVLADRALAQLHKELAADPRLVHKVKESDIREFQKTVSSDLAAQQRVDTADPA